jgi:hypothetical protein
MRREKLRMTVSVYHISDYSRGIIPHLPKQNKFAFDLQ